MTASIECVDKGVGLISNDRRKALESSPDMDLLQCYLKAERPAHCRRTLDQFSYYMLETTERRDTDQVAYKWGRKDPELRRADRPILMVDQLWMWAMHNGTVITCFPNTWDPKLNKEFDLRTVVEMELEQNKSRRPIRSPEELVHLVLKLSVDFFERKGPGGFKFQECFQSSINDIVEEQAKLLKNFRKITRILNKVDIDPADRSKKIEELFRLTEETKLLTEIMDIQDELNIVRSILTQQKDVLDKLVRIIHRPEDDGASAHTASQRSDGSSMGKKSVQFADPEQGPQAGTQLTVLKNKGLVEVCVGVVEDNLRVVREMTTYARNVQSELNHLLDLKQKQANAWEARFAREGAEQTQRQGNVMFVFTIVTIVFLPLSFIVSLVALPIREFPRYEEGEAEMGWPMRQAFSWIFGIGSAVLLPMLILAVGVNHLADLTANLYSRHFGPGPTRAYDSSSDSDETGSSDDGRDAYRRAGSITPRRRRRTGRKSRAPKPIDSSYARLLGRFTFHAKVPGVRRLWRYESDKPLVEDFSVESEGVYDYPFRRWVLAPGARVRSSIFGYRKRHRARSPMRRRLRGRRCLGPRRVGRERLFDGAGRWGAGLRRVGVRIGVFGGGGARVVRRGMGWRVVGRCQEGGFWGRRKWDVGESQGSGLGVRGRARTGRFGRFGSSGGEGWE